MAHVGGSRDGYGFDGQQEGQSWPESGLTAWRGTFDASRVFSMASCIGNKATERLGSRYGRYIEQYGPRMGMESASVRGTRSRMGDVTGSGRAVQDARKQQQSRQWHTYKSSRLNAPGSVYRLEEQTRTEKERESEVGWQGGRPWAVVVVWEWA